MLNKVVTVFTPTYNRAYVLNQLYESLLRQTNRDFCWLIVDDGSTDNTRELVDSWKKEGKIEIRYFFQKNSGKMSAHNMGVKKAETELFICVDSDDYLADDAIDDIIYIWNKYKTNVTIGIISKKGEKNGGSMGEGDFPKERIASSSFVGKSFKGDTTMCFHTSKLKKYQFPQIEGEKFITEAYLYDQIDHDGFKYIIFDKILTVCEYQTDGYTMNMDRISYNNPVGRMYHEAQNLSYKRDIKAKIKAAIRYNVYRYISGHENVREFTLCEQVLLFIGSVPGYALYRRKEKRLGGR